MRQYTRRSALKLLGLGTVAVAGFGLTGCGSSDGGEECKRARTGISGILSGGHLDVLRQ